jgi:hypothetical protein
MKSSWSCCRALWIPVDALLILERWHVRCGRGRRPYGMGRHRGLFPMRPTHIAPRLRYGAQFTKAVITMLPLTLVFVRVNLT